MCHCSGGQSIALHMPAAACSAKYSIAWPLAPGHGSSQARLFVERHVHQHQVSLLTDMTAVRASAILACGICADLGAVLTHHMPLSPGCCREWQAQLQALVAVRAAGVLQLQTEFLRTKYLKRLQAAQVTNAMVLSSAARRECGRVVQQLQTLTGWVDDVLPAMYRSGNQRDCTQW